MKKTILAICLITLTGSTAISQTKNRPSRGEIMGSGGESIENLLTKPFIFTRGELQVSGDDVTNKKAFQEAIAKSDAVIKEYNDEVTKYLASNPSPSMYSNKLNSTLAKASGVDNAIAQAEKESKQGTSLGTVYYLQKLYIFKGYLEGVTKFYPENEKLKDYLKSVTTAINSYGSRDKYMGKTEENQKNMAKNLKMIPAQQSNPKIEAIVKKQYEQTFKGFSVIKVNITYATWIVDKNELDIPLCRKLSVCVAVKNAKGECGIGSSNVKEDYIGGGKYGESYAYLPSDPIIVPCENIK